MKDNSNLRSQKINRLLGYMPKKLLLLNAVTILAIFSLLLLALMLIKYPLETDNTLLQYLLQRLLS